jgi:hypothetical protein
VPRKDLKDRPKWTDVAIVILTCGLVLVAYLQWKETVNGGEQTDRIIAADDRSATAMEDSVRQAQTALADSLIQAEVTQRAWLYVTVHPDAHFEVGKPLDIRITTTNNGRTPATNVRSAIKVERINIEQYPDFVLPPQTYPRNRYKMVGTLEPDLGTYTDEGFIPSPLDVERINDQKLRIYANGRVEYDDVFGEHHWIVFCKFLLSGGDFAICQEPEHNQQDKTAQ